MPPVGLEPTRYMQGILSASCLPIPPRGQVNLFLKPHASVLLVRAIQHLLALNIALFHSHAGTILERLKPPCHDNLVAATFRIVNTIVERNSLSVMRNRRGLWFRFWITFPIATGISRGTTHHETKKQKSFHLFIPFRLVQSV